MIWPPPLSSSWLLVSGLQKHLYEASVGNPGMVTGSTACVLVLNLTYSALANIRCVMNMPTSGRQKLRKITAGLVFHWESMGNPCYKQKDALVHPACWKLSDTSRCICRDPQDSQQRCSLKGESTHRGSTFWYKLG